jgi:AbiV family abortive infection protein
MKTESRQAQGARPKGYLEGKALASLYAACLGNARQLVDEAELLLEHNHVPRAYALAFTAYEEVGKSQIVADYLNDDASEREFEEAFWKHPIKAAYVERWFDGRAISYDRATVQEDYQARLAALYVNCAADNSPTTPVTAITRDRARDMIDAVIEALGYIEHAEWLNGRVGTMGLFK